jgi:hypothetical protein
MAEKVEIRVKSSQTFCEELNEALKSHNYKDASANLSTKISN